MSLPMPSPQAAVAAQAAARAQGVLVGCFRPPSVPDGVSRLRITVSAGVPDDDWARAVTVLVGVAKDHAMRVLVVTGTSTGVGKTVVTAALAVTQPRALVVVKPVQTGAADGDSDAREIARLTGADVQEWTVLDEPLAPDTAARRQGVEIPPVASYAERIAGSRASHGHRRGRGRTARPARLRRRHAARPGRPPRVTGADVEVVVVVAAAARHPQPHRADRRRAACTAAWSRPASSSARGRPSPGLAERCNLEDLPRVTGVPLLAVVPEGAGLLTRREFRARVPGWVSEITRS